MNDKRLEERVRAVLEKVRPRIKVTYPECLLCGHSGETDGGICRKSLALLAVDRIQGKQPCNCKCSFAPATGEKRIIKLKYKHEPDCRAWSGGDSSCDCGADCTGEEAGRAEAVRLLQSWRTADPAEQKETWAELEKGLPVPIDAAGVGEPERLWVHRNGSRCRSGDGPVRCCDETIEYVRAAPTQPVSQGEDGEGGFSCCEHESGTKGHGSFCCVHYAVHRSWWDVKHIRKERD